MTDPKLEQQLASLRPDTRVTVALQWPANLDREAFAKVSSPKDRLNLLNQHFQDLKAPVLDGLSSFSNVDVKNLPASSSAIVTATVSRLQQLVGADGILGMHREIDVFPNEQLRALVGAN